MSFPKEIPYTIDDIYALPDGGGSSYKDLNPKDFKKAIEYINHWIYEE